MCSELISIASVEGGKYHRLADKHVNREDGWKPRLMLCGRTLKPLNYFANEQDANKHTGGRFKEHACAHCEGIVVPANTTIPIIPVIPMDAEVDLIARVDAARNAKGASPFVGIATPRGTFAYFNKLWQFCGLASKPAGYDHGPTWGAEHYKSWNRKCQESVKQN